MVLIFQDLSMSSFHIDYTVKNICHVSEKVCDFASDSGVNMPHICARKNA